MEQIKHCKTKQKGYYAERMREYRKRNKISNKNFGYILSIKDKKYYFNKKNDILKYIERVDIDLIKDKIDL